MRKSSLLQGSQGLNLALHHFLSGAIILIVVTVVDAKLASQIVWLDAFITNVDRTFRNTNMLIWHKELWLLIMAQVLLITLGLIGEKHAQSPFALKTMYVAASFNVTRS
jgi:predicted cobalt transporter CbtA